MTRRAGRVGSDKKRHRSKRFSGNNDAMPIPSFSSGSSDSSPSKSPRESPSKPLWNKSCLLRTEASLEVQFLSQSRQKRIHGGKKSLPLNDFFAMARKLGLAESTKQSDSVDPAIPKSVDLSKEEQLLHDLLSVGSPTLYQLVRASPDDNQSGNSTGKEQTWCLEVVAFHGNRMEELRRLLNHQQFDDSKSKAIMNIIQTLKNSTVLDQPEVQGDKTSKASDKKHLPTTEPNILPGMNLEERVRARAHARENRQMAAMQKASEGAETVDRVALLKLADALWSHSRHIMLRQSQMETSRGRNGLKTKERSCVMTLKDVVQTFSGSLVVGARQTSGKAVSLHTTKKEKASQRQVVQALQDLERLVPGWITLVDPQSNAEKKGRVSKHATVWIKPIEYQSARQRLAGTATDETERVSKPPIGKRALSETTAKVTAQTPAPRRGTLILQEANASLKIRPHHRAARVSLSPTITASQEPLRAQATEGSPPKKAKTMASPLQSAPALYTPPSTPLAGTKRAAQGPPSARKQTIPKKRRGLRVNQNLILTDADYTGGEVIEPSCASPRGLKMLFSKLRQGKRI